MRQRLSWDKEKAAEIMKQADPYTMNQERHNPPASKYETGNPSAWAEDQNMETPWKSEGRTETGHPAPARQAVVQARKLEDKALKCVTIASRMLPGADETTLEDMATDLMFMPERAVLATLQRQSELAAKIAEGDQGDKPSGEYSPMGRKPTKTDKPTPEGEGEGQESVEAKKVEKNPEENPEKPILEAKKVQKEEKSDEPILEAKKVQKEEKSDEPILEAKKVQKEEKNPEGIVPPGEACNKEASDKDLLDILFDNSDITTASETPKVGAKKLSGIVKQASGENPLDNLWDAPPDVSAAFK